MQLQRISLLFSTPKIQENWFKTGLKLLCLSFFFNPLATGQTHCGLVADVLDLLFCPSSACSVPAGASGPCVLGRKASFVLTTQLGLGSFGDSPTCAFKGPQGSCADWARPQPPLYLAIKTSFSTSLVDRWVFFMQAFVSTISKCRFWV